MMTHHHITLLIIIGTMKFNLTQPRVLRQPDAVACTLAGELLAGQRRKGWADAWLSPAIDMKIQAVMKCKQCVHLQGENIRNRAPSRQTKPGIVLCDCSILQLLQLV